MDIQTLPNFRLSAHSISARGFLNRGVSDYHRAVLYVARLPWVHTADTGEYRGVLTAGRGTSAAKHALLAALAEEHGAPVQLVLGVYEMTAENTPAIDKVLRRYRADCALDAGCWLWHSGERVDLSREVAESSQLSVLHEEVVAPEQIGAYRLAVYQRYLWDWSGSRGWTMEEAWQVRQACVAAQAEDLSARTAELG